MQMILLWRKEKESEGIVIVFECLIFKFNSIGQFYSFYFFNEEIYIYIYQPLRSGRIWHKVNF